MSESLTVGFITCTLVVSPAGLVSASRNRCVPTVSMSVLCCVVVCACVVLCTVGLGDAAWIWVRGILNDVTGLVDVVTDSAVVVLSKVVVASGDKDVVVVDFGVVVIGGFGVVGFGGFGVVVFGGFGVVGLCEGWQTAAFCKNIICGVFYMLQTGYMLYLQTHVLCCEEFMSIRFSPTEYEFLMH